MKTIMYAGAELLTGDEIAIGVLRYCEALAGSVAAEIIEIPVRDEADGTLSHVMLLVGPTSQILARDAHSAWEEVVDQEVMHRLGERTRAQHVVLDTHHATPNEAPAVAQTDVWQSEY